MDIKQTVELYLASRLNTIDGDLKFYTQHGGSNEDVQALAGQKDPPFGVVGIGDSEEMATGSNIYTLHGAIVIITHIQDTPPTKVSEWLQAAKDVLDAVNDDCRPQSLIPPGYQFVLHGLDPGKNRSDDSGDDDMAHAETIGFTAGATLLAELTPLN